MTLPQHVQGWVHAATSLPAQLTAAGAGLVSSAIGWVVAQSPDVAEKAVGAGRSAVAVAALSIVGKLATDAIVAWRENRKSAMDNRLEMYKAETERRLGEMEFKQEKERERRAADRELTSAQMLALKADSEENAAKYKGLKKDVQANGRSVTALGEGTGLPVDPGIPPDGSGDFPTIP